MLRAIFVGTRGVQVPRMNISVGGEIKHHGRRMVAFHPAVLVLVSRASQRLEAFITTSRRREKVELKLITSRRYVYVEDVALSPLFQSSRYGCPNGHLIRDLQHTSVAELQVTCLSQFGQQDHRSLLSNRRKANVSDSY